jgi:stearoyl-CoA desaturase (delta-9 desaturase)
MLGGESMQVAAQQIGRTQNEANGIDWLGSIPFIIMHIAALCAFFWEFDAKAFWLVFFSYYVRMIAVTAGYHRYFSHRAFKTSRLMQFVIAFMAQTSAQKGALWWAANHRHHHKYSDTKQDLHSPEQHGFWWAQVGWIMSPNSVPTHWKWIQDFAKYPELVWLNKYLCRWYMAAPRLVRTLLGLLLFDYAAISRHVCDQLTDPHVRPRPLSLG